jgi:hypothetical protein
MAAWNKLNVDSATLSNNATGTGSKSLYIGDIPAGFTEASASAILRQIVGSPPQTSGETAFMAIANTTNPATNQRYGDLSGNGGNLDMSDAIRILNIIVGSALTSRDQQFLDALSASPNKSQMVADGVISGGAGVSIYGGEYNSSILSLPVINSSKIFFDSRFDYLRVKNVVDFTITLPARNRRSTGGGKKGGSGYLSYNGYADHYIYQHNYGSPPPAFTIFCKNDAGNGDLANHGITGTIPLQSISGSSFRLGLAYSTEKYLVIRERYQVYSNDIPALTLTVRTHFFENPTSVPALTEISVVHTPDNVVSDEYNGGYVWNGAAPPVGYANPRQLGKTFTFYAQLGQTFNRVIVSRTGGVNYAYNGSQDTGHFINQINGSAVTEFDPYSSSVTFDYSQSTSWSMKIYTRTTAANASFSPTWTVEFINTVTGASYKDYIGIIHRFTRT